MSALTYTPPVEGDKAIAFCLAAVSPWPDSAKRVLGALVWRANAKTGRCDPGLSTIAADAKLTTTGVRGGIKFLASVKVIRRLRRGIGKTSAAYQIEWARCRELHAAWEAECYAHGTLKARQSATAVTQGMQPPLHSECNRRCTQSVTAVAPNPCKEPMANNPCNEPMGGATAPTLMPTVNGHDVTEPTTITKPGKATRGTRLPIDWEPDATNAAYARQLGMPDAAIRREAEKFRNYWHATSGQRGVKLDWNATWCNWCIRSTEYRLKDQTRQRGEVNLRHSPTHSRTKRA